MKKVLFTLLLGLFILTGCSFSNEDKEEDHSKSKSSSHNKKENENTKKKNDQHSDSKSSKYDAESDDESTDQSNEDSSSNEQQYTSNSNSQNAKQIDIHNITDRATLEAVINSNNYSEIDKIAAYNSAVANGVIPQGNVMEGPARVESGQEKSVYDQSNQSSEEENIDDPNAEINAATNEDEYVDALRKKYNGGLSSGEIQTKHAIEQGYYDGDDAEEVYQIIQQREQDIANGKYDKYKNN